MKQEKEVRLDPPAGLINNVGDFSAPEGAAVVQENLTILSEGEWRVRMGYRKVNWDN